MQLTAPHGHHTRGALWAAASATAYSLSSVVGKDLLGSLGPTSLLFWRFTVATAVLWTVLAIWRRHGGPDPLAVPRRIALLLGVVFGLLVLLGFYALQRLDASVYIVVVYTYPVFVVVGSVLLGVRASRGTWGALALVMVGVVLTVPELFGGVGTISAVGVALTVVQALMFAAYMIISSRLMPPSVDGVVSAAWITLGAGLVMAPIALLDGLVVPRGGSLLAEVGMFALIPTVVSSVCFFRALRYVAPGVVAMVLTLEVALVIVWSVVFLGESVRPVQVLGASTVVAGVLVAQRVHIRGARADVAANLAATSLVPPVG
ncbi:MAG: DMT family transporter [Ilumatobacteraceae bacterium]